VPTGMRAHPPPGPPPLRRRRAPIRDNPSTAYEALLSMMGIDERRGWVGKSDRGSDPEGAGYGRFDQNPPCMGIPTAADLISAPPYRAASLAVAILFADGVELHPPRWVCSTSKAPVDGERAPARGVASQLSAANSNTRVSPLIRPHPPRQFFFTGTTPGSLSG
jgi:hypothetical protein